MNQLSELFKCSMSHGFNREFWKFEMKKKSWTYPAHKTIRMPLWIQRGNIIFHDCSIATVAFRCKLLEIIVPTVWFAISLMEAIFAECLTALCTEEMFRMPRLLQCSYAFLSNERMLQKCRSNHFLSKLHLKLHRYNKHNVDWTSCDNPVHSMDDRRVRRNFLCPILDCNDCKWNAPDAMSFPELWSLDLRKKRISAINSNKSPFSMFNPLTNNWLIAGIATSLLASSYSLTTHIGL